MRVAVAHRCERRAGERPAAGRRAEDAQRVQDGARHAHAVATLLVEATRAQEAAPGWTELRHRPLTLSQRHQQRRLILTSGGVTLSDDRETPLVVPCRFFPRGL